MSFLINIILKIYTFSLFYFFTHQFLSASCFLSRKYAVHTVQSWNALLEQWELRSVLEHIVATVETKAMLENIAATMEHVSLEPYSQFQYWAIISIL
jgi:hypothetical protein